VELFGLVEGGHDVDAADLHTRVSGCTLFLQMLDADGAHSQVRSAMYAACFQRRGYLLTRTRVSGCALLLCMLDARSAPPRVRCVLHSAHFCVRA
jgi:hypothetical protein